MVAHGNTSYSPPKAPCNGRIEGGAPGGVCTDSIYGASNVLAVACKDVPPYQVAGAMTVQCLEGRLELAAADTTQLIRRGDLMCLTGGETYALKPIDDSSILITMLLHGAQPRCML